MAQAHAKNAVASVPMRPSASCSRHADGVRPASGRQSDGAATREPVRVMFVQDHLGQSPDSIHGVTRYFLSTLPAFDRRIIEPSLCVLSPRHIVGERLLGAEGIRPVFLERPKWDPRALAGLVRLVRERDIDVLHLGGFKAIMLGRMAARITGRAAVLHLHDARPMPALVRLVQHRLAPWTDATIVVSAAMRQVALADYGLPAERLEVLHNGVRREAVASVAPGERDRVRAELGLSPDAPVIGILGRIEAGKGLEPLLRAMPEVLARCPRATLLVVGDGPMRQACERLAGDLGVSESVRFAGYRADIPAVLSAMDVMAAPALAEEGLGYAVLEGMCAGLPVVACPSGGLTEVVRHGETGLLVPKGEVAPLAGGLIDLLTDVPKRDAFSEAARRRAAKFSIRGHVARLQEIHQAVARLRSRRPAGTGRLFPKATRPARERPIGQGGEHDA
jgi:glycosyltransferase involved in cell wall biosynthesis